ncbi:MurR/RpiR family transcriptional regulator [Natronospora cellulosivora (SeqCode)]
MHNNGENILLKIEATLENLRPSEQKIAKYVLKNYKDVMYQTVNELASNSDVSDASVMRFVKSLGFKGFQYFKLALASVSDKDKKKSRIENDEFPSLSKTKENIKNNIFSSIQDTSSVLEDKNLEQAVQFILQSKEIFLVGVGASGINARLLSYKLLRIGIIAKYISDSHLQAMHASLIDSNSLVIGISHSGSTTDTVDALRIAHESGARTICITDHVKSPIVEFSDLLLCTYAREDPLGISQGRSSASQIYVIETLIAALYPQLKDKADKSRKKTAESVLNRLY